jgi:CMP-N,N'-diacetyllegionaminic acid synthase
MWNTRVTTTSQSASLPQPTTLCIIPARGGSKGVPRKNLIDVGGKPLIAWTIEQALATQGLDVMVSTDDEEIAEVSRRFGARVPWLRPEALAQDDTPTEPVVRHAIEQVTSERGRPDRVMLLQATSPVRRPNTLSRALDEFADTGVDSMVGVVEQPPFIWQAGRPPRAAYDVGARPRRQDLSDEARRYRETGSLYVTRTEIYEQHNNRLGGQIGLFLMDEDEGIDIDTELDVALALRFLKTEGR